MQRLCFSVTAISTVSFGRIEYLKSGSQVLVNALTGKVAHSTRMDAFESAKQSTSLRMSILLADQSAGDLR